MTQGAKERPRIGKRIKDSKTAEANLYSLFRRSNTPTNIQVAFSAGAAATSNAGGSSSEFLPTAGGQMIGPVSFFPRLVSIASGAIDIGSNTNNHSSRIIVAPETGLTDDLVTISNAVKSGQLLFLQGVQGDTITIKTTDNIETIDGTDFTLADDDILIFMFDTTDNKWQQITIGKQGSTGSGSVDPLIQTYNTPTQNTEPTTTDLDASVANVFLFSTLTKDITIDIINPPASGKYELLHIIFVQDGTGHTVSWDAGLTFTNGIPNVSETANAITNVVMYTRDQGVSWTWTVSNGGFTGTFLNTNLSNLSASNSAPTDLHLNSFDVDQVDRLLLDQAAGDSLAATDTGITSDAASNLNHNVPTGASYVYKVNDAATNAFQIGATSVLSQTIIPMEAALDDLGLIAVPWRRGYIDDITVGGATNGIDTIGHLDFVDNTATPAAALSIYSDGTDLFANTGGGVKNLSDIGGSSPLTTKGDLFGYDTADARIPVGINGQVLTADSTNSLGVKWDTATAADNLGNHTATQNLDMENNNIVDVNQIQVTGSSGDTVRGFLSGTSGSFKINSDENGSEIVLNTRDTGGSLITKLTIDETTITSNNPLVFGAVDALGSTQNGIGLNGAGVIEVNAVTRVELAIGGTGRLTMVDTAWGGQAGDDFRLFCVTSGNKAPINLEPAAGDPTTTEDGDIWYNSTSHKYKGKENGTIVTFTTT